MNSGKAGGHSWAGAQYRVGDQTFGNVPEWFHRSPVSLGEAHLAYPLVFSLSKRECQALGKQANSVW